MELEIEAELDAGFSCVTSQDLGKARRLDDASGRYIEFCKSTLSSCLDLKGLRILVDCANGAAYHVAPDVFHELGADVVAIGNKPNGLNINDGVGATHTEHLSQWTREHGCDVGISLDGDADRLIMADANGHVYNGDELLYAMVKDRLLDEPVAGVVGTLMTNFALEKAFADMEIPFIRAKVGDRYVLEQLQAHGWLLGGESSGHLLVLDKQTTGDGIVSALQILGAMRRQGKGLAGLLEGIEMMPQVLINKRIPANYSWKENATFQAAIEMVQTSLEGRGRVLIRPSGTEPFLRIMVETGDRDEAQKLATQLSEALVI